MQIKTKKWKNIILLSLFLFVIIIFSEIIPKYSDLLSMSYDLIEQKIRSKESEENKSEMNKLLSENKNLKIEINNIVSDYEENKNLSSVLNFLDTAAKESGVSFTSIKPMQLLRKDNLWLQPVEINISSKFENIYNFTRYLESSSRVAVLKELQFKPEEMLSSKLNVKANLEFYLNL